MDTSGIMRLRSPNPDRYSKPEISSYSQFQKPFCYTASGPTRSEPHLSQRSDATGDNTQRQEPTGIERQMPEADMQSHRHQTRSPYSPRQTLRWREQHLCARLDRNQETILDSVSGRH